MTYIPEKSINLKDVQFPQLRVGLMGDPGTGKTYSALTFPNPILAEFDHGLTAFCGKDITVIPFYDSSWVTEYGFPRKDNTKQPNRRNAFIKWLNTEAIKLEEGQTLIIDSWTSVINAFWDQQK